MFLREWCSQLRHGDSQRFACRYDGPHGLGLHPDHRAERGYCSRCFSVCEGGLEEDFTLQRQASIPAQFVRDKLHQRGPLVSGEGKVFAEIEDGSLLGTSLDTMEQ